MKKRQVAPMMILAISLSVITPSQAHAPVPSLPKMKTETSARQYAQQQLVFRGYSTQDWVCLNQLWTKESHWNHKADNKHSTAYGIAQRLGEKSTSYVTQINNGLRYIEHRYGNACNAWTFWKKKNWY